MEARYKGVPPSNTTASAWTYVPTDGRLRRKMAAALADLDPQDRGRGRGSRVAVVRIASPRKESKTMKNLHPETAT